MYEHKEYVQTFFKLVGSRDMRMIETLPLTENEWAVRKGDLHAHAHVTTTSMQLWTPSGPADDYSNVSGHPRPLVDYSNVSGHPRPTG